MTEDEAAAFLSSDGVKEAFITAFKQAWTNRKKLTREIDDTPPD